MAWPLCNDCPGTVGRLTGLRCVMRTPLFALFAGSLCLTQLWAARPLPKDSSARDAWVREHLRAKPEGLSLTLRAPRATFFIGERIPLTLLFSNVSSSERTGRSRSRKRICSDGTSPQTPSGRPSPGAFRKALEISSDSRLSLGDRKQAGGTGESSPDAELVSVRQEGLSRPEGEGRSENYPKPGLRIEPLNPPRSG
jgi:hypothetical protein